MRTGSAAAYPSWRSWARQRPGRQRAAAGSTPKLAPADEEVGAWCEKHLDADCGRRPMPVRRTHELHRACGAGLTGSDASGWSLLTVREKARGADAQIVKALGGLERFRDARKAADQRHHGAARGAQAALVLHRAVVMVRCSCLVAAKVLMVHVVVGRLSTMGMSLLMRCSGWRAQHSSSHGSANRHQRGKQDQQPEAQQLHGYEVSRDRGCPV